MIKSMLKRMFLNPVLFQTLHERAADFGMCLVSYKTAQKNYIFELGRQLRRERNVLMTYADLHQIAMLAKRTHKVPGAIAEIGAFEGGTAKLISMFKGDKDLYLFDTFEGLPSPTKEDNMFEEGQYVSSEDRVRAYLQEYPNVHIHKGMFPVDTGHHIEDKTFSFVHLDVDLYKSTLDSLAFFYPRMHAGGVIISHDYPVSEGVVRAFDEFFVDKPEPILELPSNQCVVVKIGDGEKVSS